MTQGCRDSRRMYLRNEDGYQDEPHLYYIKLRFHNSFLRRRQTNTGGCLESRTEIIADVIDKVHRSLVNWGIQPQLRSMKLKSQADCYVIITFPGENIKVG